MKLILVVVSLVLFLFAGVSAVLSSINLSEIALVSFGLAAYVASKLVKPTTA